jgi:uncharacterized protein (TIGR00369 family)
MDAATPAEDQIPEGFAEMDAYGAFHALVGPLYETIRGGRTVVGMRVAEKHLNRGPGMHGGMYFMLLDTAMTRACISLRPPEKGAVTSGFTSELFGSAVRGDWIEAEVEVMRAGGRVIFLNCVVRRGGPGGEPLARASGTFQIVDRARRLAGLAKQG